MDVYQQYIKKCLDNYSPCLTGTCTDDKCCKICMQNFSCKDCLSDMFRNQEHAGRIYSCIPITYTYVLRYCNMYASEIYKILNSSFFGFLFEKRSVSVVSLGCGPATELVALDKKCSECNISFSYTGYDKNHIWDTCQGIIKNLVSYSNRNVATFCCKKLMPNDILLKNTDLLILNYVISDIYKHNKSALSSFFDSLEQMFAFMPENSFIVINDVNSCNMGRDEIEEWILRLQNKYTIANKCAVFEYPKRKESAKFSKIPDSIIMKNNSFVFSYTDDDGISKFNDNIKECHSAFAIIKKEAKKDDIWF